MYSYLIQVQITISLIRLPYIDWYRSSVDINVHFYQSIDYNDLIADYYVGYQQFLVNVVSDTKVT